MGFSKDRYLGFTALPGEIVWHSGHKSGIKWRWKNRSVDNHLAGPGTIRQSFPVKK
jgi:hypothetical protein